MRIAVVVNPRAKRGRGARVAHRVNEALREQGVETVLISEPSVSRSLERLREVTQHDAPVDGFVFVGGDGLVSRMAQEPRVRALPFAVFPAGSGNDIALAFNFSRRPRRFAAELNASVHEPVFVDAATIHFDHAPTPIWCVASMGVGLIARVNRRANAYRLPLGTLGYVIALLREILTGTHDEFTITTTIDATSPGGAAPAPRTMRGLLVSVMNLQTQGGGIRLAPGAKPNDGMLDLVEVRGATRRRIVSVLPLLASARHERLPEVAITRVTQVRLAGANMLTYADGDPIGNAPCTVRVVPDALRVRAPVRS